MHTLKIRKKEAFLIFVSYFDRSKDIEASCSNGDMAFQQVRIQQSVVEFILNHTEEIFSDSVQIKPKEGTTSKKFRLFCGIFVKDLLIHHRKTLT